MGFRSHRFDPDVVAGANCIEQEYRAKTALSQRSCRQVVDVQTHDCSFYLSYLWNNLKPKYPPRKKNSNDRAISNKCFNNSNNDNRSSDAACSGSSWRFIDIGGYIGIMEKKMESTIQGLGLGYIYIMLFCAAGLAVFIEGSGV